MGLPGLCGDPCTALPLRGVVRLPSHLPPPLPPEPAPISGPSLPFELSVLLWRKLFIAKMMQNL